MGGSQTLKLYQNPLEGLVIFRLPGSSLSVYDAVIDSGDLRWLKAPKGVFLMSSRGR